MFVVNPAHWVRLHMSSEIKILLQFNRELQTAKVGIIMSTTAKSEENSSKLSSTSIPTTADFLDWTKTFLNPNAKLNLG